jgi:hypothetical protein
LLVKQKWQILVTYHHQTSVIGDNQYCDNHWGLIYIFIGLRFLYHDWTFSLGYKENPSVAYCIKPHLPEILLTT